MYIYVIRKYVKARSAADAIEKEKRVSPHDVWIEEQSQKNYIERELETAKNYSFKPKP